MNTIQENVQGLLAELKELQKTRCVFEGCAEIQMAQFEEGQPMTLTLQASGIISRINNCMGTSFRINDTRTLSRLISQCEKFCKKILASVE